MEPGQPPNLPDRHRFVLKTPGPVRSKNAGIARGVDFTMHFLRASKQWFAALLSIVSVTILVPSAIAAAPTITKLIPAEVNAGWPSFTLTVEGENFVAESKVYWADHELVTRFLSSRLLTATVPADLIATKSTALVTVSNSGTKSHEKQFTIEAEKPLITSLSPAVVAPGSAGFTLTIDGADFVANKTTVKWENTATHAATALTTIFVSASAIKATVPKALIETAGTAVVTVTTKTGGTSAPATFVSEPKPVISALSPTSAIAGDPAVTLKIAGSNFITGAKVVWKTPTKSTTIIPPAGFTATQITLPPSVTAPLLVNSGKTSISASVTVTTAAGTSAAKTFTIEPVKPLITSLSPAAEAPGGPGFTLTINGANFVKSANATTVKWRNTSTGVATALTTTSVSTSVIKATVPSSLIHTAGTAAVTVTTAAGTSASATFVFEPKPVISDLSPTSAIAGDPGVTLTISGSNFVPGTQVLWKTSTKVTTISPTGFSATKIALPPSVTAPLLVNSGKTNISASVSVTTAAGTSAAKTFTIEPAKPVITGLNPASALAGGGQFKLIVLGYNFATGSLVYFNNVELATISNGPTQLTATVPSNLIQTAGTVNVTVVSNKITSSPFSFTINSGKKPTIVSLNLYSASSGGPSFSLQVNGTGFVPGATTVDWAITGGATTSLTPSSYSGTGGLTVVVPAAQIANAGTVTVKAVTSAGPSNGITFTIHQGAPTIKGLSPSAVTAGQATAQPLTITGTQFVSVKAVNWVVGAASTPLTPFTVNSSTQITTSIPANLIAAAGRANVSVVTSAGTSNSLPFIINSSGTGACAGDGSGNSILSGVYSFQFTQIDPTNDSEINYNVGTFTADGKGNITAGIQDSNGPYFSSANENVSFTGTYSVGGDERGLLTLTYTGGAVANVCIALDSLTDGVAGSGRLVSDTSNPQIDSGSFYAQGSSNIGASTVGGSWAMGIDGIRLDASNGDETRGATAGYVTLDGISAVTAGEADTSQDVYSSGKLTNSPQAQVAITGSYTLAATGRGTLSLDYAGTGTSHYVFYLAGTNQILLLSTDTGGQGGSAVMAGRALLRPSSISFGNGTLNGNSVFVDQALTDTNSTQYNNRLVQAGIFGWNGSGGYTENYDQNDAGVVSTLQSANSTYSVDSVGRVTIEGTTPSTFGYLVDANEGFAIGGNLGVSAIYFENQAPPTGGFSLASFSGDYSEGSVGYEFVQEKASSGEVDANGAGLLTGGLDIAGPITGCLDCAAERGSGAEPLWSRPRPRDISLSETYATSAVAGRFVVMNGTQTIQALYLVSPDKAYAVDILNGDNWQPLEVFNHQ
jgi:hypothetical protein